jgi:4-aminobutyrate aminotransferase-like enzyme
VACAAALAVLDVMEAERIPAAAERIGLRMRTRFTDWARRYPCIGDVRGLGAMLALELVTDRATKAPATERTSHLLGEALRRGLLLLSAGTFSNVVRVLVPLTVSDAVLDEGLDVMEAVLEAAT